VCAQTAESKPPRVEGKGTAVCPTDADPTFPLLPPWLGRPAVDLGRPITHIPTGTSAGWQLTKAIRLGRTPAPPLLAPFILSPVRLNAPTHLFDGYVHL